MRLTDRCIELLKLLRGARWLTTRQIHRRFFSDSTMDAARKRLRILSDANYLRMYQQNRMSEALFAIGREGKRTLEMHGPNSIKLERLPPRNLEHFVGINHIRVAAELTGQLSYCFACWELPGLGWPFSIIPDAILSINGKMFAAEFDRGLEGIRFFLRTKIAQYVKGFQGLPLAGVLIITEGKARTDSLRRAVCAPETPFFFSTMDWLIEYGLLGRAFLKGDDHQLSTIFSGSLSEVSSRQESLSAPSPSFDRNNDNNFLAS